MTKKLTVFTPTYNRKDLLARCYKSLLLQTNKDFIWMIVDDGSIDGTELLVESWIKDSLITIQYFKKANKGKVSAINLSLESTNTDLWVCLDSDDYFTKEAVEIILRDSVSIWEDDRVCGLLALRTGEDGRVMNHKKPIPEDIDYATLQHIRYELRIETEYVLVYKSNIIKNYPYPIFKGEKFMPLSYIYDQIDQKYTYKIMHHDLMISEYEPEGMTKNKNKIIKNNPKGYNLFNKQRAVLAPSKWIKFKSLLLYGAGYFLDVDAKSSDYFSDSPNKYKSLFLLPLSWILYKVKFQ